MFEVIPAFSPEHRRAATLAFSLRCMMSSVFHSGGAQWTQGSDPLQLSWRSAWWRGGLPHQHPGPSPPGPPVPDKEQKGTSCFTLALCHPFALFLISFLLRCFSSSPSVFVLCDSRLLFWWIIEEKQKTKERQLTKHRDIP